MSGKRIFPRSNIFDGISFLAPGTIVVTDPDGNIQSVGIGNGLEVSAGVLNVAIPHTYDPSYGANIGTGTGIYNTKVGNTLQFKTLKGNSKVILTADADSVTINVVDVADLVHLHFIADVLGLQTALDGKEPLLIPSDNTKWLRGDKVWQPITKNDVGLGNVTNDAQLRAADLDTDPTLSNNSDTKIPSQKAVKQYVDTHNWDGGMF